jgi:tetratricopeptide (TPR) repeat protein
MKRVVLSLILLFLAAEVFCLSDLLAKEKLAVMDLRAKYGIEEGLAEGLSVVIRDTIHGFGDYEVLSKEDVEVIAERTAVRQGIGCDDTQCLINIGKSLGTKYMVAGAISKFGDTYALSLRLIDTTGDDAGVKRRVSRNCKCKEDELINTASRVAGSLMGKQESQIKPGSQERTAAEWMQMALDSRENGKYSNPRQALVYLNKAIELDPNSAPAYVSRSAAHVDLGNYQQAIADCNEAIRIDPSFALAYNNRGVAYDHLGLYDHALEDFNQAVRLDPNLSLASKNRENTLIKQQPCFIATATLGSPTETGVKILRDFRDRCLAVNSFGRTLIKIYYTYSPPIADLIAEHDSLRTIVRWALLPLVAASWVSLKLGLTLSFSLVILLASMLGTVLISCIRRKRISSLRV